jgi:hypothetical protein
VGGVREVHNILLYTAYKTILQLQSDSLDDKIINEDRKQ